MAKKKVDMLLYESIFIVLFVGVLILGNIVLATGFQNSYYNNQGAIVLVNLIGMFLGVFRIRIFFNDVEE